MIGVLVLAFLLAATPLSARTALAADALPVKVDLVLQREDRKGNVTETQGEIRIEGVTYEPPAETSGGEDAYADGWQPKNGSELMPEGAAGSPYTVSADGSGAFTWEIDPEKVDPGDMYSYRITEVPGADPDTAYDEREYFLEIFIEHEDGDGPIRAVAVLRDDTFSKPAACEFVDKDISQPKPPAATNAETWGYRGETQQSGQNNAGAREHSGAVTFTEGDGRIVKVELIDPYTDAPAAVDASGVYTADALDENGKVVGKYILDPATRTETSQPETVLSGKSRAGVSRVTRVYTTASGEEKTLTSRVRARRLSEKTARATNLRATNLRATNNRERSTGAVNFGSPDNATGPMTISYTVVFLPNEDFVGSPRPAVIRATDEYGFVAEAYYQPHVEAKDPDTPASPGDKPSGADGKSPSSGIPKTGDDFRALPYIAILAAAAVAVVFLLALRKRRTSGEKTDNSSHI